MLGEGSGIVPMLHKGQPQGGVGERILWIQRDRLGALGEQLFERRRVGAASIAQARDAMAGLRPYRVERQNGVASPVEPPAGHAVIPTINGGVCAGGGQDNNLLLFPFCRGRYCLILHAHPSAIPTGGNP
jgi:hypothetical protein